VGGGATRADRNGDYRSLPPAAPLDGGWRPRVRAKLQKISRALNLSPDLIGSLLERVLGAQAERRGAKEMKPPIDGKKWRRDADRSGRGQWVRARASATSSCAFRDDCCSRRVSSRSPASGSTK